MLCFLFLLTLSLAPKIKHGTNHRYLLGLYFWSYLPCHFIVDLFISILHARVTNRAKSVRSTYFKQ